MDLCKFKASWIYKLSSSIAGGCSIEKPCFKKQTKQNKRKRGGEDMGLCADEIVVAAVVMAGGHMGLGGRDCE